MGVLASIWLAGCSVVGVRDAPEPAFTVVELVAGVEVRAYAPRVVAETVLVGDETAARGEGFRRLAGYIFGGNGTGGKIAMTAPVVQERGRTLAMTAPVEQGRQAGGWRVAFVMPPGETLETLPQPKDGRVVLRAVPEERWAVRRYTGSTSPEAVASEARALLAALEGSAWRAEGDVAAWFYDPPWTLPPFRRNEAAVRVERSSAR